MQRTVTLEAGETAIVDETESLSCLVCDSCLDVTTAMNIFYTSLPRNGELLASFVLRVLRPAATDLRSSYVCLRCYELFRMLEQAQCTASNIRCEILKVYCSRDILIKTQEEKDILPMSQISRNEVFIGDTTRETIKTVPHENFEDIQALRLLQEENMKNVVRNDDTLAENQPTIMPDFNTLDMELNDANVTNMMEEKRDLDSTILIDSNNDYNDKNKDVKGVEINEKSNDSTIDDSTVKVQNLLAVTSNELSRIMECSSIDGTNLMNKNDELPELRLNNGLKCNICKKSFETTKDLDSHSIEHSRPYKCQNCDESFDDFASANLHTAQIHSDMKNCAELTDKEIIDFTNETFEFNDECTDNRLAINTCEESTDIIKESEKGSWKSGRISKYSQKPLKYPCSTCGKKWRTSAELKTHVKSHSDLRPYMCEKCGQAYKHKHALEIHVGMHNGISPFKCNVCNKCFTQKGALMRHLPMHTGETPYQCELCGKRFVHHSSYNMHALSHTGKKSYQCHVCDLSLLSTSHLKRHMRVHTGEKPYKCPLCGKRFAERYNLFAHQKIHDPAEIMAKATRKMMYKCVRCDEHFDKKQKLDDHRREHENIDIKKDETNGRNWIGHVVDVDAQRSVDISKTSDSIVEQTWQDLDYMKFRSAQCENEIPQISHESMTMLVSQENYNRDLTLMIHPSSSEIKRT